ncbi:hypothetical protein ACROYT_G018542 [Oculina patagonica]
MESILSPSAETAKQKFCVEMMKGLDTQRQNEQFCDVILEVGSGDDQARLKAHRIVLCAGSPFFDNALNSDMKEKKEGLIRLEETSKAVMEEVLEYLYTGHVDIKEHNAYELLAQSDYFLIPSLKLSSSKFILQTLSLSNCIGVYYLAVKYRCEDLQKGAKDFILANFLPVSETEDFLNLSSQQVEEWISRDEIIINGEEEVFEVIVKWVEKNGSRKHQCFYELFQHVRLVYVPLNYLTKVILPHRFVKSRKRCSDLVLDAIDSISEGTEERFFSQSARNCLKTHEDVIAACGKKRTLCYHPSENKWYELAGLLPPHNPYSYATTTCHGKLYVVGGNVNSSTYSRYEPSLNLWTSGKAPESDVSGGCAAAVTLQGFLYVIGGKDKDEKRLSTVQKFNPDTHIWQDVSSLGGPRSSVCAVADGNYLYAIGGVNATGKFLNTVERFDPRNNTWDEICSTLARRRHAGGAAVSQRVFVFGGLAEQSTADPCEMYDPTTNKWTGIPGGVSLRGYASAVSFKGKIYVFGGIRSEELERGEEMSLQVYDVNNNTHTCVWEKHIRTFFSRFFKMSRLRILRDVLATCKEVKP